MPSAPAPIHVIRTHSTQVNALYISHDNERIYSGDLAGHIIVTSTETLRPIMSWKAHNDGILGLEEWQDSIITHGRDNKLHIWERVMDEPRSLADVAAAPDLPLPTLKMSLNVNALNFCRFSLLASCKSNTNTMLAVPNLIDSSLADIWVIPVVDRIHAAVGLGNNDLEAQKDGRGTGKMGIIMSLHLFEDYSVNDLRLLLSYESGDVTLFAIADAWEKTIQGRSWQNLWRVKLHVESVMAMSIADDNAIAITVSADNLICKYNLKDNHTPTERTVVHRTKYSGNSAVAIQDGGRIVAVGGWDGKVRLYSTRTFKRLGTLEYHKEGCQDVAFSHPERSSDSRNKWLAVGGKDRRISFWELMDFRRNHQRPATGKLSHETRTSN